METPATTDSTGLVKNSMLYKEFLAEREEILCHKWIESEKAVFYAQHGRDVRVAPGVNMEHRRDGHVDVSIVKPTVPDCSQGGSGR
ncbi:MAG: hypothetical protein QOE55_2722 [Acidobacteriaceae bacterium]|jgi:hypothetical protein|nr:hypothetical protein [Acidobacteriaceae bacterium]